jgi:hypothetical protein
MGKNDVFSTRKYLKKGLFLSKKIYKAAKIFPKHGRNRRHRQGGSRSSFPVP